MSKTPLAYKLKLKPATQAAILNPPEGYLVELGPERVTFDHVLSGRYEWIQVFVKNRAEIADLFPALLAALEPDGLLWISFPKVSSKIQTDLTRDQGWEAVSGLKRIMLVSIDLTWSAFSFRPYRPGEAR
jgi:hypothetical protein